MRWAAKGIVVDVKEAKREVARVISQYRSKPYDFWERAIDQEPITLETTADSGKEYQIEIQAFWDDKSGGNIRVIFSIDDGGWRAFCPLSKDFLVTKQGGSLEG